MTDGRLAAAETMSIGDVARHTGLSVHTLRFYERQDLLVSTIARTNGGRRIYTQADVSWLQICTKLRASGMPLADLHRFAALVRSGPGNERERLALLREHQRRVQDQMDRLHQCLDLVTWKVGYYEDHVAGRNGTQI